MHKNMRTGELLPQRIQPEGVTLPYPASFYNPRIGAQLGTVNNPRLAGNTSRVQNVVRENPGNSAANSDFFYPNKKWYVDKYMTRRQNAVTSHFDPLGGYLTGETLPLAHRPVKVVDISTGMYAFSDKPQDQRSNSILQYNYHYPQHKQNKTPAGVPLGMFS
jgi:hypothetical protein